MPDWKVIEPTIDLRIHDEPMAYQSSASRISFQIDYWQRNERMPDTNVYTLGPGWEFSWQSYIAYTDSGWTIFSAGGGEITLGKNYSLVNGTYVFDCGPVTYAQNLRPTALITNVIGPNGIPIQKIYEIQIQYPSGAKDIYAHAVTNCDPYFPTVEHYDLSQKIDEHGRVTTFVYAPGNTVSSSDPDALSSTVQLAYVIDPDGKTNTLSYTNYAGYNYLISQVQDPFGHTVKFAYNTNGCLTNVTDVAGISSSFGYANIRCGISNSSLNNLSTNYWLNQIKTPYGTTSFSFQDLNYGSGSSVMYDEIVAGTLSGAVRSVVVTEPNGSHQMFMYRVYSSFANSLMNWTRVPTSTPDGSYLDNDTNSITDRSTFYWGRKQFATLSLQFQATGLTNWDVTTLAIGDYLDARWRRWLFEGIDYQSDALSMEQDPSPDGSTPGQSTWYNYPDQESADHSGSSSLPSLAIKVLPEGTQSFEQYQPDQWGNFTNVVSTWSSVAGESALNRTNRFVYSTNGVDLLAVIGPDGTTSAAMSYDSAHQPLFVTNAVGDVASFSYNINEQLIGILFSPGGLQVTNIYNADGFLQEQRVVGFTTNFYTYINGLVDTHTDELGLKVTNTWDLLQRLTKVSFPDGTAVSLGYNKLDLASVTDRMGYPVGFAYNEIRQRTYATNALSRVTSYGYCDCGALNSIVDALNQTNLLNYDNQGNLTNANFPDGSSINRWFDLDGRLTQVADGAGRWLKFGYNNQGLVTGVTNANGTLQSVVFDVMDRPIQATDANGVTVTNSFDALGRLLKQTWPDGISEGYGYDSTGLIAFTNRDRRATHYSRDASGRLLAETNANLEVTKYGYNSASQLTDLWDGNTNHVQWQVNQYGWLTNKINGLSNSVLHYAYNANGWLTNRWTPEKGDTFYTLDNIGNLTAIAYPQSSISFAFDALNRLTNMVDAVGNHNFTWTPSGQLKSESGPWANDTVSHEYVEGLPSQMTIGTNWAQQYFFDLGSRMTNTTSPAGGFIYSYNFQPASALFTGIALPNGAKIVNSYDSMARLTSTALNNYWGHTLDGYDYTPDAMGFRTNIVRNLGLTTNSVSIGVDNIGQLTSWSAMELGTTLRQNEQLGWQYDPAHNLHTRVNGGLTQTFTTDAANQLKSITRTGNFTMSGATPAPATNVTVNGQLAQTYGDLTFARTNLTLNDGSNSFTNIAANAYGLKVTNTLTASFPQSVSLKFDQNGNLTNDGVKSFAFDCENQLTNVGVAGQWQSEFVYDGLNRRRIERDYIWQGGGWVKTNEIRLLCDGYMPIQERDSNNVPQVTYTRGLDLSMSLSGAGGIGGLLARTDTNGSVYYHGDGSGNITALIDTQENIVGRYLYGPFGKLTGMWGPKAQANVMRFSSMPSFAWGSVGYPERFWLTDLDRWLNNDPIQEAGGINLMMGMNNNPMNFVDPLGLDDGEDDLGNIPKTLGGGHELLRKNADEKKSAQLYDQSQKDLKTVAAVGTAASELNPVVGGFNGGYGAIKGKDAINGNQLTGWERVKSGGGALLAVAPVVIVKVGKVARVCAKAEGVAAKEYQAFKSFDALKRALGPAGDGRVWHHIVEQRAANVEKFGAEAIHNTENVVNVTREVNQKIANYYSSKDIFTGGKTVRDWLGAQSLEQQREFGLKVLKRIQEETN
jgi:RHS repeat-associated protein